MEVTSNPKQRTGPNLNIDQFYKNRVGAIGDWQWKPNKYGCKDNRIKSGGNPNCAS
jgi:hypothetical protein